MYMFGSFPVYIIVIFPVRANQRRNQDIEQLERLHELKEQGLITFEKLSFDNHEFNNNSEILGT